MRKFLLSGVALLALGEVANADVVITATTFAQTSAGAPAPSGTGTGAPISPNAVSPGVPTPFGPGGAVGGLSDNLGNALPLITFNLPFAGTVKISLSDISLQGDVFQAAVDGLFVGETNPVPLPVTIGPSGTKSSTTNSHGTFTVTGLSAGTHTLGIEDIILSYEGSQGPFGPPGPDGIVPAGGPGAGNQFDPAGFVYSISEVTTGAPEPATLATLGIGLLGLAAARQRRKK